MSGDHDGDSAAEERAAFVLPHRVRDSVVHPSEGLSEDELRTPGVPSGTNLLGLVRHLSAMEVLWFQRIFLGEDGNVDDSVVDVRQIGMMFPELVSAGSE